MEQFIEFSDDHDYFEERHIVFWVIRVLFVPDRPGDRIPIPAIAVSLDYKGGRERTRWPLNPIDIVDDIPFMVGHQVNLGGQEAHPSSHVEWARQHGTLREKSLSPATNPLAAAEQILRSRRFRHSMNTIASEGVS